MKNINIPWKYFKYRNEFYAHQLSIRQWYLEFEWFAALTEVLIFLVKSLILKDFPKFVTLAEKYLINGEKRI